MKRCPLLFALALVTGLLTLTACGFIPQQTANNLPVAAVSSANATRSSLTTATAPPTTQPDAWTQAQAQLPANVPVYKPTWVPSRFGPPALEEARVDSQYGPLYTITYSAQDEGLAFILNMGKGALGNFPPSEINEPVTIHGVQGGLSISKETHSLGIFWKEQGGNYQIKAFSKQMTKDELLRIAQSIVPVPALQ